MKRYTYIVSALLAFAMTAATWTVSPVELTVTENSRLWVDGTSTIHDWSCDVGRIEGTIVIDASAKLVPQASLRVPASSIECNNGTMNRKAADALQVDDHPTITFTLSSAAAHSDGDQMTIEASGMLELAGVTQSVTTSVIGKRLGDGTYTFAGSVPVKMSDYDIKPPSAMLGTIKTGDQVTVHFELTAAPTSAVAGTK